MAGRKHLTSVDEKQMPELPPLSPANVEEFEERRRLMEEYFRRRYGLEGAYPDFALAKTSASSGWLTTALQSITLAMILAGMFWLGSLSTTVTTSSQKLDKLNDGVVGISKDSLSNRMTAIETKLDSIDKRLEALPRPTP